MERGPLMGFQGGLVVEPDSIQEGGVVEVAYDGPGPLYYRVDLGPWMRLPLDENGKGSVEAPPGASVILFSDRRPEPQAAAVAVISTRDVDR